MSLRLGIIDPDTSHARAFTDILRTKDVLLEGIYAESTVRKKSVVHLFAQEYGFTEYNSLTELCDAVDAVLILSADWSTHREAASTALQRDKITLVDKPIAGSIEDSKAFEILLETYPSKLFGGSSLLYTTSFQSFLRGKRAKEVLITGPGSDFFLQVHKSELAAHILQNVQNVTVKAIEHGYIIHSADQSITIREQDTFWKVQAGSSEYRIEPEDVYDNYLDCFLQFARGEKITNFFRASLGGCLLEIACEQSKLLGRPVAISELSDSAHIPSAEFIDSYRKKVALFSL